MTRSPSLREFICHGKEERCFKINGKPMPICSRCFGYYTGIVMGLFLGSALLPGFDPPSHYLFLFTLLAVIPLAVDGLMQELTSWESHNWIRFFTGIILGSVIGIDIWWILVQL